MKERKTRTAKQVWIICSLCLVFCAGETYAQRRGISMEMKQEFLKAVAQGY